MAPKKRINPNDIETLAKEEKIVEDFLKNNTDAAAIGIKFETICKSPILNLLIELKELIAEKEMLTKYPFTPQLVGFYLETRAGIICLLSIVKEGKILLEKNVSIETIFEISKNRSGNIRLKNFANLLENKKIQFGSQTSFETVPPTFNIAHFVSINQHSSGHRVLEIVLNKTKRKKLMTLCSDENNFILLASLSKGYEVMSFLLKNDNLSLLQTMGISNEMIHKIFELNLGVLRLKIILACPNEFKEKKFKLEDFFNKEIACADKLKKYIIGALGEACIPTIESVFSRKKSKENEEESENEDDDIVLNAENNHNNNNNINHTCAPVSFSDGSPLHIPKKIKIDNEDDKLVDSFFNPDW